MDEEKRGVYVWRVHMVGGGAIGCEKRGRRIRVGRHVWLGGGS
jgi:hypothetical protein